MNRPRLRLRPLLYLLVFVAVLPALGVSLRNLVIEREMARDEVRRRSAEILRQTILDFNEHLNESRRRLATIGPLVANDRFADPCGEIARLVRDLAGLTDAAYVRSDGLSVCTGAPVAHPVTKSARSWYRRAIEERSFVISRYQICQASGRPELILGYPAIDEAGTVRGAVSIGIDVHWINHLTTHALLPEAAEFFVLDRDGRVIARRPEGGGWTGKLPANAPIVAAILRDRAGRADVAGFDGTVRSYSFEAIYEGDTPALFICTGFDSAVMAAHAQREFVRNVLGLVLSVLVAIVAIVAIERFYLRRIKRLGDTSARIAAGDLAARSGLSYDLDELGEHARSFDHMAAALEERERKMIEATDGLRASEERFRRAVLDGPVPTIISADDGEIVAVSRVWTELSGYSRADIPTYADWTERALGARRESAREWFAAHGETDRRVDEGPLEIRTMAGERRVWEFSAAPLGRASDGRRLAIITARDITTRRAAEARLLHANRLFAVQSKISRLIVKARTREEVFSESCRVLVDTALFRMVWVGLVHPVSGQVRPVAWDGHEEGYLARISVIAREHRAEGKGPTGQAILSGRHIVFNDTEHDDRYAPWRAEALARGYRAAAAFPLRAGDRVIGSINVYAGEVNYYGDEEVQLLNDLADDIAFCLNGIEVEENRARAEEALRLSEQRFRVALRSASITVMAQDLDLRYTWVHNPPPGMSARAMVGRTDADLLPAGEAARLTELKRRAIDTGRGVNETVTATIGGTVRRFELTIEPHRDAEGEIDGIIGSAMDITDRWNADEEIRRLARFPEENPAPIVRVTADGEITYRNPAAKRRIPWAEGARLPDDIVPVAREAMITDEIREIERIEEDRTYAFFFAPVVEAGYANLYAVDRTETNAALTALRASEEKFRTLAEFTYDWEYWENEGRFVYTSPSCERITGYGPDEFYADPELFYRIVHPDDRTIIDAHRTSAIEEEGAHDLEFRIVRKSGEIVWIRHTCQPIFDAAGKHAGRRVTNRDVTERKKAEDALRRERDLIARIMETSPAGIMRVLRDGRIASANLRAQDVLGLDPNEIAQRRYNSPEWRITDYDGNPVPDEDLPFARAMRAGETVHDVRIVVERPTGERVLLSCSGAPIRDEQGEIESVVFTIEDVTAEVEARKTVPAR